MKNAVSLEDAATLDISDIFDLEKHYVEMVAKTKRDNRQGIFHPSTVGMCGRRNVYEYTCAPCIPTIEPDSLEIFDLGHAIHRLVGTRLTELKDSIDKCFGYEFQEEVGYDPAIDHLLVDFGIGGTCDGLLKIWTNRWAQRSIIETKSINKDGFSKLVEPKEDHLMQAHIYAHRFNCPIMYIWYYCKDNSKRQVFPVVYQESVLLKALKRFEGWLEHVDRGTLPEREESWFACPRCEYRELCKPSVLNKIRNKKNSKSLLTTIQKTGRLR